MPHVASVQVGPYGDRLELASVFPTAVFDEFVIWNAVKVPIPRRIRVELIPAFQSIGFRPDPALRIELTFALIKVIAVDNARFAIGRKSYEKAIYLLSWLIVNSQTSNSLV